MILKSVRDVQFFPLATLFDLIFTEQFVLPLPHSWYVGYLIYGHCVNKGLKGKEDLPSMLRTARRALACC